MTCLYYLIHDICAITENIQKHFGFAPLQRIQKFQSLQISVWVSFVCVFTIFFKPGIGSWGFAL